MPKCKYCGGTGKIPYAGVPEGHKRYPECKGAKEINGAACAKCEGKGYLPLGFLEKLFGKTEGEPCGNCKGKGWL
mgnify:FL=1